MEVKVVGWVFFFFISPAIKSGLYDCPTIPSDTPQLRVFSDPSRSVLLTSWPAIKNRTMFDMQWQIENTPSRWDQHGLGEVSYVRFCIS